MQRIDGADQLIAGLEAKVDKLVADNKALREENAQRNEELDALYAEPQWFSHRGDHLVIVAVVMILAAAGYYVGKLKGWW